MDKILHHQGWWISHDLQAFNLPRWCRILSINSNLPGREIQQHQPGPVGFNVFPVSRMAMERSKAQSEPSDDISRPQPEDMEKSGSANGNGEIFPLENWS